LTESGEFYPEAANHNPLMEIYCQEESSAAALGSELRVNGENLLAVMKQEDALETANLNQIETASKHWAADGEHQVLFAPFFIPFRICLYRTN
jgi:hypothetical protein